MSRRIKAVTLDFGDTLYPHRPREMERILSGVVAYLHPHLPPFTVEAFLERFVAIRTRQFRENRPTLRENDLPARMAETITALAGSERSADLPLPTLVAGSLEAYAEAFHEAMVPPPWLPEVFHSLSRERRLCVISNYPVAEPIRRALERDGLLRFLDAVVVSAEVGFIKPHPMLFEAALHALDDPEPAAVVHVGDDWDADILGAAQVGIRTVYTRQWRDIPDSHYATGDAAAAPLAEIHDLRDLPGLLDSLHD